MKGIRGRTLKSKVIAVFLTIFLIIIFLLGAVSFGMIFSMKRNTLGSLEQLQNMSVESSTASMQNLKIEEIKNLARNKARQADISLSLILNQTRMLAMAAEDVYSNQELYLPEVMDWTQADMSVIDFSCNYSKDVLNHYSIHLRAPKELLKEGYKKEYNGKITRAELDTAKLIDETAGSDKEKYRKIRELSLARYLMGELGGIRNFDNGDGTYNGIGATYFCLESSGIDVLADTLTTDMVVYDAREKEWYQEAKKLGQGEVYFSKPIQDGSGRGNALICSMPIYAGNEFIGAAGSGGRIDNLREMVYETQVGEAGYAVLINTDMDGKQNVIVNANQDETSELEIYKNNLHEAGGRNPELGAVMHTIAAGGSGLSEITLDGHKVFMAYAPLEVAPWSMITIINADDTSMTGPIEELDGRIHTVAGTVAEGINRKIQIIIFVFIVSIGVVIIITFPAVCRFTDKLVKPIMELTGGAEHVSGGELDFAIHVNTGDEIEDLGNAFNRMTENLKAYIENLSKVTAEKERISTELNVAAQIQGSMLPCIFPAFPERPEFDIFAMMHPAKEVGGDFYDFFMVDEHRLAFVIADVSGKGVPAALFMVIAKTLIKNYTQLGYTPAEIFEAANNQLSENNEAVMFVTAWLGILDLSDGEFVYVNAGHNPPLLKEAGGSYEYLETIPGFVLAGMKGMEYRQVSRTLRQGDCLYLYTDGVTESMNTKQEQYGEKRLREALNRRRESGPEELLSYIKGELDTFREAEEQFDDITMLGLKIHLLDKLTVAADREALDAVLSFINGHLDESGCPEDKKRQIDIAAEEIFVNIANYAYEQDGLVWVEAKVSDNPKAVRVLFMDRGIAFNPLAAPEPDITLSAGERQIGGLGIYLVKQSMDSVTYSYKDGKNILVLEKIIDRLM